MNGCDDYLKTSTRRAVMLGAVGLGAALWGRRTALAQAAFRPARESGPVLVNLFLRGGADGLNMVAPYADDHYQRARPTLALQAPRSGARLGDRVLDADGHFGFHPALAGLHSLFHDGRLAVVHAAGSGDESRSHFEAMGTMERGQFLDTKGTHQGWIARYLAATPRPPSPLRAVAFASTIPDSLTGALNSVTLERLDQYKLNGAPEWALDALESMYTADDPMARAGAQSVSVLRSLADHDPAASRPRNGAKYPDSPLGRAFRDVAFLTRQGLRLEVAFLEAGGWDTQVAQGVGSGWQANLLRDLGDSVAAFYQDLGAESDRVALTVQTEFGRRLEENSGFGTDHGHGGVMFVAGGRVRGGKVYGDWPGLAKEQLTGPGDLSVTTDYRTVLAEAIERHLRSSAALKVFEGLPSSRIGLF